MMAIFAMDIGWVSIAPVIGLPATLVALVCQTAIVAMSRDCERFEVAHSVAILLWVMSNAVWMFSEYLWDEARPEGVLALFPSLSYLDKAYFPSCLLVASVIMWATVTALGIFYAFLLLSPRSRRSLGWTSVPDEDNAFGIPLHIYRELFVLPWLISDSCWILCNRREAMSVGFGYLAPVGVVFGIFASFVIGDAMFRFSKNGRRIEAMQCAAELLWVGGNTSWYDADMNGWENTQSRACFCLAFTVGLYLTWLSSRDPVVSDSQPFFRESGASTEKVRLLQKSCTGENSYAANAA